VPAKLIPASDWNAARFSPPLSPQIHRHRSPVSGQSVADHGPSRSACKHGQEGAEIALKINAVNILFALLKRRQNR